LVGAVSQSSILSGLVRMTGIVLGWIGATISLGSVVKKAKRSLVVSPSLIFRVEVHVVQIPAKKANGLVSSSANQTAGREPFGRISFSEKLVNGTIQRFSGPSHRRQCAETAGVIRWSFISKADRLATFGYTLNYKFFYIECDVRQYS
jgi:hypothetical protein